MIQLHWQVESGDLVRYGLIPEFIGRLPILVSLAALNEGQLVQVACSAVILMMKTN
jgi:ATP-dependent protease Clp ATPase subunit